jgi:hypothetical protein
MDRSRLKEDTPWMEGDFSYRARGRAHAAAERRRVAEERAVAVGEQARQAKDRTPRIAEGLARVRNGSPPSATAGTVTDVTSSPPPLGPIDVHDVVALLNDAEHYAHAPLNERLAYLERRAQVLHQLVDASGDESSRYLAQDAEDRALDTRQRAEALATHCGDPQPAPPTTTPRSRQV